MFLLSIKVAVMAAIIGYVYAEVLIQPGEALNWFYRILLKLLTKKTIEKSAEVPEELIGKVPQPTEKEIETKHWLLKPLGDCSKCVSGQLAFWIFLFYPLQLKFYFNYNCTFTLVYHLFTICLAILLTITLKQALMRL